MTSSPAEPPESTLAAVLSDHFVMWVDDERPAGPIGSWCCECGAKFGFSHNAIEHVAAAILAATPTAAHVEADGLSDDPGVCWRGECRFGCYYTDGCSLGDTTRPTNSATRVAELEAALAAAEARLRAFEALAARVERVGPSGGLWVGDEPRAILTQPAEVAGRCIHVPPSPGQSLCQCKHQQIEMEYAARIAEAQRGE